MRVRQGVGVPDHHILGVKAGVAAVAGAWGAVIRLLDVDGAGCLSRKAIRLTTAWVLVPNEPTADRVATQPAIERSCWWRVFCVALVATSIGVLSEWRLRPYAPG